MQEPTPRTLGRYELVSLLGRGGHGEVWLARKAGPMGFAAEVAVKVLNATGSGEQLQQEARLGALLRHPNVVAVHGLEEVEGRWLMEMELVDGSSLRDVLKRRKKLSARALVQLGRQVLEGLAHIHHLVVDGSPVGLVHRDIKPGNLLVDRSGTVRIADLGVACLARTHVAAGTIGYASPEQLRGDPVDGRADLFSLACVLGRACGRPSLVGRGDLGMVRTLALQPARVASWVEPLEEVLPGLAPLLARWLHPLPDERPGDAREAMEEWSTLDLRLATGMSLAQAAAPDAPEEPVASMADTPQSAQGRRPPPAADPDPLVGRDALLGKAEGVWAVGPLLLVGPGGIGKTRLARALAHRRGGRRGGTWVDLSAARSVHEVRSVLGAAFGVPASSTADELAAAALTVTKGGRRWVVLDTLEQLTDLAESWLDAWVDAVGPMFTVLGTSRRDRPGSVWQTVPVGPLDPKEAAELYRLRCPVASPSDAEAIDTVVRALEGVPLAVELVARARMGGDPAASVPARHRSLDACLDTSWSLLGLDTQAALVGLSVFEGPIDRHGAQAVIRPAGPVVSLVQELSEASLVQGLGTGRVHLLDVVRRFVRRRADPAALALAEQRHADWFDQLSRSPRVGDLKDLAEASRRARSAGRPVVARRCALGAWRVLEAHGPPELGVELLEPLVDGVQGEEGAKVVSAFSSALAACGRLDEALALLDDRLAHEADPGARAMYLERRGARLLELGRFKESQGCLRQAVALNRARSHLRGEGDSLGLLGVALHRSGAVDEAIECYQASVRILDALGDDTRKASSLTNYGSMLVEIGRGAEAQRVLEEAVRLHRQDGVPRLECVALVSLAMLLGRAGRLEQARRVLARSIRLARRVGSIRSLAFALCNLGMLQHALGEEEARPTFERALSAVARCRDPRAEAHIHMAWGHWAFEAGDPVAGRQHLELARSMGEALDLDGLGPLSRALLAWLELDLGHLDRAETLLNTAEGEMEGPVRNEVAMHVALVRGAWAWCHGHLDDGDAYFARGRAELEALGCRENSPLGRMARRIEARFRPTGA